MYGNKDKTVKIRNIENLAAAIRSKQGKVTTIFYPQLGHIGIVTALSILFRSRAPVLEDVAAFVHAKPVTIANSSPRLPDTPSVRKLALALCAYDRDGPESR